MNTFISVILQLFYFNLQGNHWLLSPLSSSPAQTLQGNCPTWTSSSTYVLKFTQVLLKFPISLVSSPFWETPDKAKTRDREVESHQVCYYPPAPWPCPPACFSWEMKWRQESMKEIQVYTKYRFEWQAKQIYSLYGNHNPRGANPWKKCLLGRWRPLGNFPGRWSMSQGRKICSGSKMYWTWNANGSPFTLVDCAHCLRRLAVFVNPATLCGSAPSLVLETILYDMALLWDHWGCPKEKEAAEFSLCSSSLLCHLTGPFLSTFLQASW